MRRLTLLALGALILTTTGCYGSVGPTISFNKQGVGLGWEASGGPVYAHVSTGQTFRQSPPRRRAKGTQERVTYVTVEPGLVVGGALGYAWVDISPQSGLTGGIWAAAPAALDGGTDCAEEVSPVASVALGWRFLLDVHEFYIAPKLGYLWCNPPLLGGR